MREWDAWSASGFVSVFVVPFPPSSSGSFDFSPILGTKERRTTNIGSLGPTTSCATFVVELSPSWTANLAAALRAALDHVFSRGDRRMPFVDPLSSPRASETVSSTEYGEVLGASWISRKTSLTFASSSERENGG